MISEQFRRIIDKTLADGETPEQIIDTLSEHAGFSPAANAALDDVKAYLATLPPIPKKPA
jgi:hypothetical protein